MTNEQPGGDLVPRPDPSLLTTAQLQREIAALKELMFTRIDAMEKAVELLHEDTVRIPTDTDKQVGQLKALHEERFESIKIQFADRDTRVTQGAAAQAQAVAAALQAQKELAVEQYRSLISNIEKSEKATAKNIEALEASSTKQGEGLGARMDAFVDALTKQINDGKDRLTRIETFALGRTDQRVEARDSSQMAIAVIGGIVGVAGLVLAAASILSR